MLVECIVDLIAGPVAHVKSCIERNDVGCWLLAQGKGPHFRILYTRTVDISGSAPDKSTSHRQRLFLSGLSLFCRPKFTFLIPPP